MRKTDYSIKINEAKIAAAREIAEKHNVNTEADIENLEKRLKALPDLITSAKNEVADEQLKLKRVTDLITAYEKIVEGGTTLKISSKERFFCRVIKSTQFHTLSKAII